MADESDDKLSEIDRLLNDPDVPMRADRVWELVDELATRLVQPSRSRMSIS